MDSVGLLFTIDPFLWAECEDREWDQWLESSEAHTDTYI